MLTIPTIWGPQAVQPMKAAFSKSTLSQPHISYEFISEPEVAMITSEEGAKGGEARAENRAKTACSWACTEDVASIVSVMAGDDMFYIPKRRMPWESFISRYGDWRSLLGDVFALLNV